MVERSSTRPGASCQVNHTAGASPRSSIDVACSSTRCAPWLSVRVPDTRTLLPVASLLRRRTEVVYTGYRYQGERDCYTLIISPRGLDGIGEAQVIVITITQKTITQRLGHTRSRCLRQTACSIPLGHK